MGFRMSNKDNLYSGKEMFIPAGVVEFCPIHADMADYSILQSLTGGKGLFWSALLMRHLAVGVVDELL